MATAVNLMAFGVAPDLARRIGVSGVSVTCQGGSVGSAAGIIGHNAVAYVVGSNSGSGVVLPSIGGDVTGTSGALVGDRLRIYNLLGASIVVYAPGTMTFIGAGASTTGSTGISVAANHGATFDVLTASTYGFIKSSA